MIKIRQFSNIPEIYSGLAVSAINGGFLGLIISVIVAVA